MKEHKPDCPRTQAWDMGEPLTREEFEHALFTVLDTHTEPFEHWKACKQIVIDAYDALLRENSALSVKVALCAANHGETKSQ